MKPSDNEIEMLAAGFAIQHKNGLIRFAHALLGKYASARAMTFDGWLAKHCDSSDLTGYERELAWDAWNAALASAPVAGEAQPVAWRYWNEKSRTWNTTTSSVVADVMRESGRAVEPLYAAPQASEAECSCPSGNGSLRHPCAVHPQASEAVRLDAPAQVGNVRFGKGVHWSTVIAAAQRHHAFMNTPEKEAERIARAKAFVDSIQVDESPNLQGSPVDRSDDLQGGASEAVRDVAFEAVRKLLCAIPRYSFYLDDDGVVRRVEGRSGNWIEFDAAHELFDPVAVDAALSAQPGAQKTGGSDAN